MAANPEKSAKFYVRHFNRFIQDGGSLYCESPLGGPPSRVTDFRTRNGVLFGRSARTGKWLPTKPDRVKQSPIRAEIVEEETTMKVNEAQNTADAAELSPRPAQHTEGPWFVSQDRVTIYGAFRSETEGYPLVATAARPEDAESIVKAVNSHEALIEAIKSAIEQLEQNPDITLDALDELRAALRVAGVS